MDKLEFTPQNPAKTIYTRRMHGAERMMAAIAHNMNGYGHMLIGAHVILNSDVGKEDLLAAATAAWMRTRFSAPWLGIRTMKSEGKNSWLAIYEVPDSPNNSAVQWASKTIKWRDELRTAAEWEDIIKNEYWRPGDDRYSVEYHIARAIDGGYFFMASIGHWLTDARGFFPTMDIFFGFLEAELQGSTHYTAKIAWGEEVSRLPPAIITGLETTPDLDTVLKQCDSAGISLSPKIPKHFSRPLKETENWKALPSRQTDIILSKEQTQTFHNTCKRHNVKATAVLNSISLLAEIQTSLLTTLGSSKFKDVLDSFQTSELYTVGGNVADRRSFLKQSLMCTQHAGSFGNVVCDTFVTTHTMESVRKCFNLEDEQVSVVLKMDNFWRGVVKETESQLRNNIQSTPDVFYATQIMLDQAAEHFDPAIFKYPGIVSSSFGRFSSLKLLESFTPAIAEKVKGRALFVQDAWLALRASGEEVTAVIVMTWEYDGRLVIHLLGSSKWQSDDSWRTFVESYSGAMTQVLDAAQN